MRWHSGCCCNRRGTHCKLSPREQLHCRIWEEALCLMCDPKVMSPMYPSEQLLWRTTTFEHILTNVCACACFTVSKKCWCKQTKNKNQNENLWTASLTEYYYRYYYYYYLSTFFSKLPSSSSFFVGLLILTLFIPIEQQCITSIGAQVVEVSPLLLLLLLLIK